MSTLVSYEEILKRFPTARYEPKENCQYCDGKGIRHKKIPGGKYLKGFEGDFACICIFVDHDMSDLAQSLINKTIQNIRDGK